MDSRNLFGQEIYARRGETTTTSIGTSELPVGVPVPWPAAVAPTGWLICDGGAIPAGCPTLTALYGANLPNLKGHVIVGFDAAQAEFNTLLTSTGAKTVAIGTGNLPAHTHGLNGHNHGATLTHGNTGNGAPANHAHALNFPATQSAAGDAGGTNRWHGAFFAGTTYNGAGGPSLGGVDTDQTHQHGGPGNHTIANENGNTTNGGFAGTAINNLQPSRVFNYIVRAA